MPYSDPGDLQSPASKTALKGMVRELFDSARKTLGLIGDITNSIAGVIKGTPGTLGNLVKWGADGKAEDSLLAASAVPKCVNRQDNITNNTVSNQLIQTGWGFVTGNGSAYFLEKAITFPIPYDGDDVIVFCSIAGGKNTTDPAAVFENTIIVHSPTVGAKADAYAFTRLGFKAVVSRYSSDGSAISALANGTRYMFTWIAIGTKGRT